MGTWFSKSFLRRKSRRTSVEIDLDEDSYEEVRLTKKEAAIWRLHGISSAKDLTDRSGSTLSDEEGGQPKKLSLDKDKKLSLDKNKNPILDKSKSQESDEKKPTFFKRLFGFGGKKKVKGRKSTIKRTSKVKPIPFLPPPLTETQSRKSLKKRTQSKLSSVTQRASVKSQRFPIRSSVKFQPSRASSRPTRPSTRASKPITTILPKVKSPVNRPISATPNAKSKRSATPRKRQPKSRTPRSKPRKSRRSKMIEDNNNNNNDTENNNIPVTPKKKRELVARNMRRALIIGQMETGEEYEGEAEGESDIDLGSKSMTPSQSTLLASESIKSLASRPASETPRRKSRGVSFSKSKRKSSSWSRNASFGSKTSKKSGRRKSTPFKPRSTPKVTQPTSGWRKGRKKSRRRASNKRKISYMSTKIRNANNLRPKCKIVSRSFYLTDPKTLARIEFDQRNSRNLRNSAIEWETKHGITNCTPKCPKQNLKKEVFDQMESSNFEDNGKCSNFEQDDFDLCNSFVQEQSVESCSGSGEDEEIPLCSNNLQNRKKRKFRSRVRRRNKCP